MARATNKPNSEADIKSVADAISADIAVDHLDLDGGPIDNNTEADGEPHAKMMTSICEDNKDDNTADWNVSEPLPDFNANGQFGTVSEEYNKQYYWWQALARLHRHFVFSRLSKTIHHDEEDELVFTKPAEVVSAWLKDVIQPTGLEEGFQETSFTPDDPNEEAWIGVNDEARSSSEYEKEDEREYW